MFTVLFNKSLYFCVEGMAQYDEVRDYVAYESLRRMLTWHNMLTILYDAH